MLVQGTGGVSTFALQFAHAAGATAIVTSSSDEKLEHARTLGASETINYKTTPEWGGKVLELTKGHGADLIVEVWGSRNNGAVGEMSGTFRDDLHHRRPLRLWRERSGGGAAAENRARGRYLRRLAHRLQCHADLVTQHRIHPLIDHVYSVGEIDQARKQLEDNQVVGKLIVRM